MSSHHLPEMRGSGKGDSRPPSSRVVNSHSWCPRSGCPRPRASGQMDPDAALRLDDAEKRCSRGPISVERVGTPGPTRRHPPSAPLLCFALASLAVGLRRDPSIRWRGTRGRSGAGDRCRPGGAIGARANSRLCQMGTFTSHWCRSRSGGPDETIKCLAWWMVLRHLVAGNQRSD